MGDKQKKKMTKKELKAANHAKLMSNRGAHALPGSSNNTSNVVQVNFQQNKDKDKKAA